MAASDQTSGSNPRASVYLCAFCGEGIDAGGRDPCAIQLVTNADGPAAWQRRQTFFCHLACMQRHAVHAPYDLADP